MAYLWRLPKFCLPDRIRLDDRFDYRTVSGWDRRPLRLREVRQVAFGSIYGRLFACVFVDRGSTRRIISLRKANSREVKRYGEKAQQGRG
jgi:uncharacterized DUF497 family protein